MSGGLEDMKAQEIYNLAIEDVAVNHPAHYNHGGVECIDAIQASLTAEEFRGYLKGNIIKYIWRERHKHGVASLKKGQWYLNKLVDTDTKKKGP